MSVPAVIAWASAGIFALLAAWFWLAPGAALEGTGHRADALPAVLGGRYAGMAALAALAWLVGGAAMLGWTLVVLGGLGLVDAAIYAGLGAPFGRHLFAGVAGLVAGGCVLRTG